MTAVIQQTNGLLKNDKFCIVSSNNLCVNCPRGIRGCCCNVFISRNDFNIDFTSFDEVKRLFETKLFYLEDFQRTVDMYDEGNDETYPEVEKFFEIYTRNIDVKIRRNEYSFYDSICIFWTDEGCRLSADKRPKVCRHTCCGENSEDIWNMERKDLANYIKGFTDVEKEVIREVNRLYGCEVKISQEKYLELDWEELMKIL